MSLLDSPVVVTPAQQRASRALALPRAILNRLLQSWGNGLDLVWNPGSGITPAEVVAALGPNAGEVFRRSEALRGFLEGQRPGCTNIPQASRIKAYTINADGTVTVKG